MQYTEHNKLNLPELVDQYNLKHWNENTTKIDDKLNEHQVKLDTSTSETTPSSLMMRNEQGKVKVTTPLEQDDTNMAVNIDYLMNAFRTKMLDEAHPKGSYYDTDDKNFDPNVSWIGTWVRVKDSFRYSAGDGDSVDGNIEGSKKISVDNLPSHTHSFSGTSDGATAKITSIKGGSHSHSYTEVRFDGTQQFTYIGNGVSWIGWTTGSIGGGSHTHKSSDISQNNHYHSFSGITDPKGGGTDYMPPHIKVYTWHRTE